MTKNDREINYGWDMDVAADGLTFDFASLGIDSIAFVKPTVIGATAVYAIFSADGEQLGLATDRESALATVRNHELEPSSVH